MEREGLVLGMDEDTYHGGGAAELSSTGAKLLLDAPAMYKHEIIDGNRVEKKAWDIGTAVHTKVLGVGQKVAAIPAEFITGSGARSSSKAAVEWAADQKAAGFIVLKESEIAEIDAMAESLLGNPDARAMLTLEGHSEVSVFSTCPETGARLRSRFDRLASSHSLAGDVKSVGRKGGAKESEFVKQIFNFGYDIQGAQYVDSHEYATGERIGFQFLVVETVAPYLTNVIEMLPQYMDLGHEKSMEARRRYVAGIESGEWPGYPNGVKKVDAPLMAVYDFQDNYEQVLEMTF